MGKEIKRYSIDQCALCKCRSKRRLEQLLCIEAGGLKEIENIISFHIIHLTRIRNALKKAKWQKSEKLLLPMLFSNRYKPEFCIYYKKWNDLIGLFPAKKGSAILITERPIYWGRIA